MRQRIFWTCVLPEHLIAVHGLSFAACNFSFSLMSGGVFDKVYSSMPIYVGGEMQPEAFTDRRFTLEYDRWRKKRGICRKLATFKEQYAIFRHIPNGSSVWFYNLNTLNALLFLLLKWFKSSVQLNVIVLDFTPVVKGFGLNQIYLRLINRAHGRICLASSELFCKENSVVLPGVVPSSDEKYPEIKNIKKSFLLSGALSEEISMLPTVLEVFSEMPDCELYITGSRGDEQLIQQYSGKYANIHWYGQLHFKDYLELLHDITFQLSTRDIRYPENQCNFPSKIIEALLHNRIVISTIEYPQLEGVRYITVNPSKEGLLNGIKAVTRLMEKDILSYANQGDFVRQRFSCNVWKDYMIRIENNYK